MFMSRLARESMLFLLIVWLTASTLSSSSFAEWKLVPEGWTTTEPGYFGTLEDGRDTLTALQTYRQTSERWKAAYSDLRTEFITTTDDIKKQVTALEEQINNERRAWKAEVVRGRTNNLIWFFIAGGIGYAAGR
jgi:hypothetical protein